MRSGAVLALLLLAASPQSGNVAVMLADELEQRYIDEAAGRQMASELRRRVAAGEFDAPAGDALAAALNRVLRSVTNDPHLGVRYSADPVVVQPDRRAPSSEDRERLRTIAAAQNFGFEKVERLPGNVGFMELNGFADVQWAGATATAAMAFLANTDAVIIDLRYNGGGVPGVGLLLSSYFFERPVHLHSIEWREPGGRRIEQFWTLPFVPGPRFLQQPLFVLTSDRTMSAAESFAYSLQAVGRAKVVGEVSAGGGHAGGEVSLGRGFVAFIPTGRAVNPTTRTNWEGTGVRPDVLVDEQDALRTAHATALETLRDTTSDPARRARYQSVLDELARSR